jgi:hypothetical protein
MAKLFGLGFEAGDSGSGFKAVIVIIYFIFLIVVINAASNITASTSTDLDDDTQYNLLTGGISVLGRSYCTDPRYEYDKDTLSIVEASNENYLSCSSTKGVLGQTECDTIDDCDWTVVNATTGFWSFLCVGGFLCDTVDVYHCKGNINVCKYGINTRVNLFGTESIDVWNYDDYTGISASLNNTMKYLGHLGTTMAGGINAGYRLCEHPYLLLNQSLCESLMCTWTTDNPTNSITSTGAALLGTAGKVFTFSYDFDPTDVMNDNIETILYLIFIMIPFMLLLVYLFYAFFGAK